MYGANNEPTIIEDIALHPATWKWDECTSEDYYDNVNASTRLSGLLTYVRVYRKP